MGGGKEFGVFLGSRWVIFLIASWGKGVGREEQATASQKQCFQTQLPVLNAQVLSCIMSGFSYFTGNLPPRGRHFYVLQWISNHCSLLKVLLYPLETESHWTTWFCRKGHSFSIIRETTIPLPSVSDSEAYLTPPGTLEGSSRFSSFFFLFSTQQLAESTH